MNKNQKLFLTFNKKYKAFEHFNLTGMSGSTANKKLNDIIKDLGIEYVGWEDKYDRMIYSKNPSKCKECGSELDFERNKNSYKFCNSSCRISNSNRNRKHSKETKNKIAKTLRGKSSNRALLPILVKCDECESEYNKRNRGRSIFCSDQCQQKSKSRKLSNSAKLRHKEGKLIGWQTRNKLSYPERFFKKVLELNGFKGLFEINYPVRKKELGLNSGTNYFLDFYFPHLKLDLEIDGKQHSYPDRIERDTQRDNILSRNDITVYRIKWKSINTESGKEYIKKQIEDLISYLNNGSL